jgi:hypothetical protein
LHDDAGDALTKSVALDGRDKFDSDADYQSKGAN